MTCVFGKKVYEGLLSTFSAFNALEVLSLLKLIDKDRKSEAFKFYYVGFINYDALEEGKKSQKPLAFFMLFKEARKLGLKEFKPPKFKSFMPSLTNFLDSRTYVKKIDSIKSLIKQGEVYQINFTHMLEVHTKALPKDIFSTLYSFQKTKYVSLFDLPFMSVISLSPELFFSIDSKRGDEVITTMPMKGTIRRGTTKEEDKALKSYLKNDIKNRSENVMITDLLRNDLSKVAREVKVTKLFAITSFKSLHQMISVIEAKLESSLAKTFSALFPCGSITGAPKKAAISHIKSLEFSPRNLYCGAIGVISSKETKFNVAIRTLFKYKDSKFYNYAVGGGIVWDSKAKEEENELRLKARFLSPKFLCPSLEVFETMLFTSGIRHQALHIKRLTKSLEYFGVPYDKKEILRLLASIKESGVYKLSVSMEGRLSLTRRDKKPITTTKIAILKTILDSKNDLLYHKTSSREMFTKTMEKIAKGLVFDEIFCNEKGELTQGTRSNFYVLKDDILLTPPLECGLLGGTYRAHLLEKGTRLDSKLVKVKEAILLPSNLKGTRVFCSNAVYGLVEVRL
ncbi:bifunctional anthranilate synthase component I family protein/class IV aminotransferase [Helicobacter sp. 11S02629-2]|uniref:chorismate-binding protein n=1 Tax=Helicobacter sp. 11S02629-2 TaxID=1476195 RepID=UPI000BA5BF38|nr:bifunctional anthranilate synthase component I family protein/class IV aminotransferase [Helicobacter sp. 11S02629-2]PAF43507.1 hypothetical protein BKH40_06935 [Helicobacter sp. 11S02629-2]